jgi:alpha-amylase/alpha-mannosidase (GH57 family)
MKNYVCIHGHFYQPPRENPWLEKVAKQMSAYPYHDWNQRIASECYRPNYASRLMKDNKIVDIVNNYASMSFNFGPTLLSWLKENEKDIYEAVLRADSIGKGAIAQAYNHMIMPLASDTDKRTQIKWGIKDFEYHFKRKPNGMWLPETAVDTRTLEILNEEGIEFTILSPYQAKRVQENGMWILPEHAVDFTLKPYLCALPNGRNIAIFFYDKSISHDIAFGGLLNSGNALAERLLKPSDRNLLVNVAVDGETFGHHHKFGDMALAYCFKELSKRGKEIVNYAAFLEKFPPTDYAEIFENSSWSCAHGVGRWMDDCSCKIDTSKPFNQKWRKFLRQAMNFLRDKLKEPYEKAMDILVNDPWKMRDEYIDVLLDRSEANVNAFLKRYAKRELTKEEKSYVLSLLEMERNVMLSFTSCGWFFDEISGIEVVQILLYAARSMQIASDVLRISLEDEFLKILEEAKSNIEEYENGKKIYELCVRPQIFDFNKMAANFALISFFHNLFEDEELFCYRFSVSEQQSLEKAEQKLICGRLNIFCKLLWSETVLYYAILYHGGLNVSVVVCSDKKELEMVKKKFVDEEDSPLVGKVYTLKDLFKDEQSRILDALLSNTVDKLSISLQKIILEDAKLLKSIGHYDFQLPFMLKKSLEAFFDSRILQLLEEEFDFDRLNNLIRDAIALNLQFDNASIQLAVQKAVDRLIDQFEKKPYELENMERIELFIKILSSLKVELNFWRAQNVYFNVGKNMLDKMKKEAAKGDVKATKWVDVFSYLAKYLSLNI